MTTIESDVHELREDISGIHDDITGIKGTLVGHEVRFSNGREIMAEMKAEIQALKPKAPDWVKLLGVVVAFFVTSLGAHYWLIEQFNDRPTAVQIEKTFHEHSEVGHAGTQRDMNVIRESQTEQRVILNGLESTVTNQGKKLDTILNRLPVRHDRDP